MHSSKCPESDTKRRGPRVGHTQMPTLQQRLATLAAGDQAQLKRWKGALKWARDRAPDHAVHMTMPDGRERSKLLFDDYSLSEMRTYDDETLVEMVDWLYTAQMQYQLFL